MILYYNIEGYYDPSTSRAKKLKILKNSISPPKVTKSYSIE